MRLFQAFLLLFACFSVALWPAAHGDDWPQWTGPNRDSVWSEDGVIEAIPEKGLPVKWRAPVELGYSGPAVADGRVFVTDYVQKSGNVTNNPGGRDKLEGVERTLCFDAADGKTLWKHEYLQSYEMSYPRGPRCTPTVSDGKVYVLGAQGKLWCLDAAKGAIVWQKDLVETYKTETPFWGFAAHPLVDGDLLYCVVGGPGSVVVSFNKHTGAEVFKALSASEAGYCPPTMIEHAGVKQLLVWHPESLNSLNPLTGEVYWTVPLKPAYSMSVTAPRKHGKFLYVSGIGNVSVLLELADGKPGVKELWRGKPTNSVYNCNAPSILEDGMIYGCDCRSGELIGVQMSDGARLWKTLKPTSGGERTSGHGTAFLVKHADRYFLFSETGDLILAKLSAAGYEELGRSHVVDPTNEAFGRKVVWSHPAFANRCLFARNDKELVCVDLAAAK